MKVHVDSFGVAHLGGTAVLYCQQNKPRETPYTFARGIPTCFQCMWWLEHYLRQIKYWEQYQRAIVRTQKDP